MILKQLKPQKVFSSTKKFKPVSKDNLFNDTGLFALEKATQSGATTMEDIAKALDEYQRLFKAGLSSNAEKLTLARAFPDNARFVKAAMKVPDNETMVIGGPASVELIDREGHLITNDALGKAFHKYMDNFRTRNAMVLHSDVQVGWALPAYITKGGQIYKSGVGEGGLFFICELRGDTKIADKVSKQIEEGKLRSYSIAGSATKIKNMQKGIMPYMQVDEMELAEVTVCEKGVNQAAGFQILKAQDIPDEDEKILIADPEEDKPKDVSQVNISINLLEKEDGDIDFTNTFFNYMTKIRSERLPDGKRKRGGRWEGETNLKPFEGKTFQRRQEESKKPKVDDRFTNLQSRYDPYLDEPVTLKPVMTAEERKEKNIFPSIMDRSIENMAEASPQTPKTPNKPPSKTRRGGSPSSNGHYPNKEIPTNPNMVNFLNHMEKGWESDMASDMASGWGNGASAGDFQSTMTGTKEQKRAARQALKNKLAGNIKSEVAQGMEQGQQTPQASQAQNHQVTSMDKFLNNMEKTTTTGEYKPRGVKGGDKDKFTSQTRGR